MSDTKTIYQRLSDFREDVGKIAKDGANPAFRSKYATLPGILDAIQEPLKRHGLTFVQTLALASDGSTVLVTELTTLDGGKEKIASNLALKPADAKPQTLGSCITYARRYSLVTVLGLNVDDDDDGNLASGVAAKVAPANTTAAPKPAAKPTAVDVNPEDIPF